MMFIIKILIFFLHSLNEKVNVDCVQKNSIKKIQNKIDTSLQFLVLTCHLESVNFSHVYCVAIALLNPTMQS